MYRFDLGYDPDATLFAGDPNFAAPLSGDVSYGGTQAQSQVAPVQQSRTLADGTTIVTDDRGNQTFYRDGKNISLYATAGRGGFYNFEQPGAGVPVALRAIVPASTPVVSAAKILEMEDPLGPGNGEGPLGGKGGMADLIGVFGVFAAVGGAALAAGAAGGAAAAESASVFTAVEGAAVVDISGVAIPELGLVANEATAAAAIEAGIPAATLGGGSGAITLDTARTVLRAIVDISKQPIPELGLVATPETATAAIQAGIPAELLSGGPGAITLSTATVPSVPSVPSSPSAPAVPKSIADAARSLLAPLLNALKPVPSVPTVAPVASAPAGQGNAGLLLLAGLALAVAFR